jgi:hypothetical protein
MKKLMIVIAAAAFSFTSFAQNSTSGNMEKNKTGNEKTTNDKMSHEKSMKHYYEMKNGKMMEIREGKTSAMTNDVNLENGSMLMTNGTVKMKDGSTKKVKEGDCVYMDGKIEKMKMDKKEGSKMDNKDGKMENKNDDNMNKK